MKAAALLLLLTLLGGCGTPTVKPRDPVDAGTPCTGNLCAAPAESGLSLYFRHRYGLDLLTQPQADISFAFPLRDWIVVMLSTTEPVDEAFTGGLYAIDPVHRHVQEIMAGSDGYGGRPVALDEHRVAFEAVAATYRGLAVWDGRTQEVTHVEGNTSAAYLHGGDGNWLVYTLPSENQTRARSLWALNLESQERLWLHDELDPRDSPGSTGTLLRAQVAQGWAWLGFSQEREGGFRLSTVGINLATGERRTHSLDQEHGGYRFHCGRLLCGFDGGSQAWSVDLQTGDYTLLRPGLGGARHCAFPHGGGEWLAFACDRPTDDGASETYALVLNGSSGNMHEYVFQFLPPPDDYSQDARVVHVTTNGKTVVLEAILMDPQRFPGNATKHVLLLATPPI